MCCRAPRPETRKARILRSRRSQPNSPRRQNHARASVWLIVGWRHRRKARLQKGLRGQVRLAALAQRKTARFARSSQSNWRQMAPERIAVRVLGVCVAVLFPLTGAAQQSLPPADRGAVAAGSDSVQVVAAAVRALGGKQPARWRVASFQRDSAGAIVSLVPPCPKLMTCMGGGGRVRVRPNGRTRVLERYR